MSEMDTQKVLFRVRGDSFNTVKQVTLVNTA